MKTCYQCDKEVHWLAPDSRCGDCTRLTPEQVRGEEPMPDEAEQEFEAFLKRYGICEQTMPTVEGVCTMSSMYRGCQFKVDIVDCEYKFTVNDDVLVQIDVEEDKQIIEFINEAENAIKTKVDFATPLFKHLSTMTAKHAMNHLRSLDITIMASCITGPDWFITYSYQGLWSIGPGALDFD